MGRSPRPSTRSMENNKINDLALRAEPIWDPETHTGAWRAVGTYSAEWSRRDQKTLAAQEARARRSSTALPGKTARGNGVP
jgi:hypothetical protein